MNELKKSIVHSGTNVLSECYFALWFPSTSWKTYAINFAMTSYIHPLECEYKFKPSCF